MSNYPNADDDQQCPVCAKWRTVYEDHCPECVDQQRRDKQRRDSEQRRKVVEG